MYRHFLRLLAWLFFYPLLAIAQAKQANPLVLIDEIEKTGTRSDYGRFWDCLLGFLELETAARYPDPALQTTLDLSQGADDSLLGLRTRSCAEIFSACHLFYAAGADGSD